MASPTTSKANTIRTADARAAVAFPQLEHRWLLPMPWLTGVNETLHTVKKKTASVVTPVWLRVLVKLPIPSEMKWQHALNFVTTLTISYYQDLLKLMPLEEAMGVVTKALSISGRRWMRDEIGDRGTVKPEVGVLADALNLAFRSLNIDSSVQIHKDVVTVTNHKCPYLEMASKRMVEGEKMCEMLCGQKASFCAGLSEGFVTYVRYRPEAMMGLKHKTCIKHYTGIFKAKS